MKEWNEINYGPDGASLWLLYPGTIVLSVPIYFIWKLFVTEDFTGAFHVLIIFVIVLIVLIDRIIFGICSIPKLKKQIVGCKIGKKQADVSCYFNKKCQLTFEMFQSLETCNFGFWYLRYSYLSDKKDNYCLTTRDGQKFYISGAMPEVESLIAALKSIIQKNQETETETETENKDVG